MSKRRLAGGAVVDVPSGEDATRLAAHVEKVVPGRRQAIQAECERRIAEKLPQRALLARLANAARILAKQARGRGAPTQFELQQLADLEADTARAESIQAEADRVIALLDTDPDAQPNWPD